ncbi:cation diffusion facilitator family transporter [Nocardioides bruguierae]|uniref:Cation diffusion facilitator family transporter n=1 Tax=Nocardioides bruguierae TaxID=2945102 RepID=A0A9X2D7M6_9ACTN|nr:cation diffusion facilitator family transporter [Nocardioides bruguierae]MCM0620312.1 cation diffusion facilitator family transporter [Nocardioides bruguierae]
MGDFDNQSGPGPAGTTIVEAEDLDPQASADMDEAGGGSSLLTVVVALTANGLLAIAKTVAAVISGSASMLAEAAHSWSDTGNEVFLLVAEKAGAKPRDEEHPRGYGRATYIWSLVAAFGLFTVGSLVSIWTGVSQLIEGGSGDEGGFTLSYVVLAVAFVLEGTSFVQAARQVRGHSKRWGLHPLRYVSDTSNPTLRAVVLEDSSALVGIVFAAAGIALHQATGDARWDAIGSIGIGLLLAVVAIFLIRRNMEYLLGEGIAPAMRSRVLARLLEHPEIDRITYLHVEYVGPQRLFVVAAVDLVGDDTEPSLARRLRRVEHDIETEPVITDAVLTLAPPEDAALQP